MMSIFLFHISVMLNVVAAAQWSGKGAIPPLISQENLIGRKKNYLIKHWLFCSVNR